MLIPFIYNVIGGLDDVTNFFMLDVNIGLGFQLVSVIAELYSQSSGVKEHLNPSTIQSCLKKEIVQLKDFS
jgi:hypothetical protein